MKARHTLALTGFFGVMLGTSSAFAEVEVSGFGGQHLFSVHNALGRTPGVGSGYQNSLSNSGVVGARFTYMPLPHFGGELELSAAPTTTHDGSATNIPSLRFNGMFNILTGRVRPFATLGAGALVASPSDPVAHESDLRFAAIAGAGVRVDVGDWWGFRGDGRIFAMPGIDGPAVAFDREWTLGIYGRFPAPPAPELEGREGEALIDDEDGDGLGDRLDKCPSDRGPVKNYGCPLDEDRDKDGIADGADKCPDLPGTAALSGCVDSDNDGFMDPEDRCPTEAGIKELRGCPDKDRDGDGIVDRFDKCDLKPETVNGFQDEDGCPDTAPVVAKPPPPPPPPPPIKNIDAIDFARGLNTLTPESLPVLDAAAEVLKVHPEAKLQIVGYTDATGNEANNLRLSRDRAEVVRAYLIKRGLAPERITAIGRGSADPLTTGTTEEDRGRNRRVEFRFDTAPAKP